MSEKEEKKTKDFTEEVKLRVPEYEALVKADNTKLAEALENLLALEKKTRLAADVDSTVAVSKAILNLCKEYKEWKLVNEHITLLCKRRAQLNRVVLTVVREGVAILEGISDKATRKELIETLRTVSAGKIVVELERARLTRQLVQMKEDEGEIAEAAEMLGDCTVETIGAMEISEKAQFLQDQMRLCMANKDYVRAEIVSKKITPTSLDKEEMQDLKLSYYKLMIELHEHNKDYLAISKCYEKVFHTPKVQDDEKAWTAAWTKAITFVGLAQFDSEVSDMLERFKKEPKTEKLPLYKTFLNDLTTIELMDWPMAGENEFKSSEVFQGSLSEARWKELHRRIVQHNIRVISTYYTRITTGRLAELLKLDGDAAEDCLSEMVSNKQVFAKIDRCAGKVKFQQKQTPNQVLNEWAGDISSLLSLVDKTCHLIHKENMLHGIA